MIEKLNQKIFEKRPESNTGNGWQLRAIVNYMTFDSDEAPSEILTNRKIRVSKIIEIGQSISHSIEPDWSPYDPENALYPSPFENRFLKCKNTLNCGVKRKYKTGF